MGCRRFPPVAPPFPRDGTMMEPGFVSSEEGEARGADSVLAVMPYFAPGLCGAMYLACRQGQITKVQRRAAFGA